MKILHTHLTDRVPISSRLSQVVDYLFFVKPFIFLILVWELVVQLNLVPNIFLPHTYNVLFAAITFTADGTIPQATLLTLQRALGALAIAIAVGVPIGLLMGQFRALEWFFDPLVSIGFPIPKVTLIPVFLLWIGFGSFSKVLLAASDAVFPIIISTYAGTRGVKTEMIWSARSLGLSRAETAARVTMPAVLPEIFDGIQVALPLSFIIIVVSEMVMGGGGLGEMIVLSARFFETPKEVAAILAVAMLGFVSDRTLRYVRARFLHWDSS